MSNKKRSTTVGSEQRHPYTRGYSFWKDNAFWENDSVTEKGKEYFRASLDKMSKVYNLTKVDQSLS